MSNAKKRAFSLLACVCGLAGHATAGAATVLRDDLQQPLALAVRPAPQGQPELVVACGRSPYVQRVRGAAQPSLPVVERPPDALPGALPTGVALLDPASLVVGWASPQGPPMGLALYGIESDGAATLSALHLGEQAQVGDSTGPPTGLLTGPKYLYAIAHDERGSVLLRARHNAGGVAPLRPLRNVAQHGLAFTVSPQGYLVVAGGQRLEYFAPDASAGAARLSVACELPAIQALAYGAQPRPSTRMLYALSNGDQPGFEPGVYRLDAARDDHGDQVCRAVLINPVERPLAMAFGPAGNLYVLAAGDTPETGRLYLIEGDL